MRVETYEKLKEEFEKNNYDQNWIGECSKWEYGCLYFDVDVMVIKQLYFDVGNCIMKARNTFEEDTLKQIILGFKND